MGIPTEPQTFNPLLVRDLVSAELSRQLHASLVRVNLESQRVEPMLAERWEVDDERTTLTMWLRSGVAFSDGEPFSASDVAFTMDLLSSGSIPSQFASNLQVQGEPIEVEVVEDLVVRFRLPSPVARPERLFTDIGILPSHVLGPSAESSDVANSMGPGSEPAEVVGLGPFRLDSQESGRRTTLVPNPHYWGLDEQPPRPRLAGVVFEVVADAQTNLLRLRAGELDVVERLSPDSFAALADEALAGEVRDIGPGMTSERLWFNLNPRAPISETKKAWFSRVAFRRAVARSLDREALARVVFQGYASPAAGPVSPANSFWVDPESTPFDQDLDGARALLRDAGFRLDADTGRLLDETGAEVRFRLMTSPSPTRQRTAAFIQEDLAGIGIGVDLVVVEAAGLMARLLGDFDYDACLLGITQLDPDPSAELPIWTSSGQLHVWSPAQESPATAWERELDELMLLQMQSLDQEERRRLYREVQRVVLRELPIIDLVYPHVLFGARSRVSGLIPTPFGSVLWNLEEISLDGPSTSAAALDLVTVTRITEKY